MWMLLFERRGSPHWDCWAQFECWEGFGIPDCWVQFECWERFGIPDWTRFQSRCRVGDGNCSNAVPREGWRDAEQLAGLSVWGVQTVKQVRGKLWVEARVDRTNPLWHVRRFCCWRVRCCCETANCLRTDCGTVNSENSMTIVRTIRLTTRHFPLLLGRSKCPPNLSHPVGSVSM